MITRMVSFKGNIITHSDGRGKVLYGTTPILSNLASSSFCDITTDGRLAFICPSSNSESVMQVFDGATIRDCVGGIHTAKDPIRAALCCIHRGVLFVARTKETNEVGGTEVVENRIWWSDFGDLEEFQPWGATNPNNFEDIGDDGEPIVRLISHKNNLYVMKRNSIWRITGTTSPDGAMVGPESIIQVVKGVGLVAPNAITDTGKSLIFLSDQGLTELVGDQVQNVNGDIHEHMEDMNRSFWVNATVCYDKLTEHLFFATGDHRKANDHVFVFTSKKGWMEWKFPSPASCIETLTKADGTSFVAIGDVVDGVGILDPNCRMDYDIYPIDSTYGTDWLDLGCTEIKDIRSLELLLRVEGDFPLTVNVYHDMSRVAHETHTFQMRFPDAPTPITGEAQIDVDSTADRHFYFPFTLDLNGRCRKIRFELVCTGDNNRFQVVRMNVGFLRTTRV